MRFDLALILPGVFYPVAPSHPYFPIKQVVLGSEPYVIYNNLKNKNLTIHSDICPHMNAALSSGWLYDDSIVCPYHGFVFREGRFCGIQGTECKGKGGKRVLTPMETYNDGSIIYTALKPKGSDIFNEYVLPYQPPEVNDKSFRAVFGYRDLPVPQQMVTENLLDMLHISFVHSFGNPQIPLAHHIKYQQLSDISGKTTFTYVPRPGTLSTILAGKPDPEVFVENEFYIPSTTITRVRVGKDIKTVLTRVQPINETSCRLFWYLYRNFFTAPFFDCVIRLLMERTIDEDAYILSNVVTNNPSLNLKSRYDITIEQYRLALKRYKDSHNIL